MIEVPEDNAFAVNVVGTAGDSFPFSLSWEPFGDDIFRLDLVGLRARDLTDLLPVDRHSPLLVFGVGHYWLVEGSNQLKDLAEVADDLVLQYESFDVGWADHTPAAGRRDALLLSREGLTRLLEEVAHYELKVIDVATSPTPEEVDEIVLRAEAPDWEDSPFLLHAPASRFFLHVHDDIYVWLESRSEDVLWRVAARGLAHFIGEFLRKQNRPAHIVEPPAEFIRDFVRHARFWTLGFNNTSISGDRVLMNFTEQQWRLADDIPDVEGTVATYNLERGEWAIAGRSAAGRQALGPLDEEAFEVDGSFRDIYVLKTTISDWQTCMDHLRSRYWTRFTHDGDQTKLPEDVRDLFQDRQRATTLNVNVGGLWLNCHFFDESEIEFDLDPREVRTLEDADKVRSFMTELGTLLTKEVVLTPENTRESPIYVYRPGMAGPEYTPP